VSLSLAALVFLLLTDSYRLLSRFSPAIKELHDELRTLRDQAFKLQTDLRERYSSKNLTLKVMPKIGAAAHILSRDGVMKIEEDPSAHLYQKSNSTRAYVIRVRYPSPFPVVEKMR